MSNRNRRQRREQASKNVGNRAMNQAMLDLRNGSRTDPVPSGTTYNRNKGRKHRNRQYEQ